MTTSSAPGKIILFGEHAVVYGRPALAVPVAEVRARASVLLTDSGADSRRGADLLADSVADSRSGTDLLADSATDSRRGADFGDVWVDAPDIGLHAKLSHLGGDHPLAAVVRNVSAALGIGSLPPITIRISSTIPVASGLGSGAAVSVAVIRALSKFLGQPLADEQVCMLAFEIEKLHHGTPSGIDNTVIAFSRPVYFVKGQPIEMFRLGSPLTFVIADTGITAPTKESVGDVRKLWEANQVKWEKVFDEIGAIANLAKERIVNGHWVELGSLMDRNHALLQELTVSSPELDRLVDTARMSGALGAKLSGGGRGGNMIALVQKENAPAVAEALKSAGAKRTIVTTVE